MTAGSIVKGWPNNNLTTYTDGYTLGTNKEPPYAYLVLAANITFGGFSTSYSVGTQGLLIFVQDATGGRTIDWNGKIAFVGGQGINLAANSVTAVDVIKTPLGWIGFLRDIPQGTFVNQVNGHTGNVTLGASDLAIVDAAGYFAAANVEAALAELFLDVQAVPTPPRAYVTSSIVSFDLTQVYAQKVIRMTNTLPSTVNLSRVNFNIATLGNAEFVVTNRGSSTVTLTPDGSVSLSYINPGVSLVLNPGQTLFLRYTGDNGSVMSFDVDGYQAGTTIGLSLLQTASQSAARSAIGVDSLTSPLTTYPGKNFDGSTMYMNATAASMGIADAKAGTLVLSLRFANNASGNEFLINNPKFSVSRNSVGNIVVTGKNAAGTTIMSFASGSNPCALAGTYVIMVAWDLATAGTGRLYVNDVSDYVETTYTNDTINYNNGSWFVAADTSAANKFTGDMYVLWFDPTARMGFNSISNRRRYIDPNSVVLFLGRQGQLPTGSQVGLFHAYNAVPNWKTNRGSFNFAWTDNGVSTAATTLLKAQYSEFPITTYFETLWSSADQATLLSTLMGTGTGAVGTEIGLRLIKQTQSITGNYTIVAGDSGGHLYHPTTDTTARTITVPANSSVAFPIGTVITIDNDFNAGVITIAITTDTLVLVGTAGTTGSRTLASGGQATLLKVTATRWRISGTGLT